MTHFKNQTSREDKGFTLIELLVVILIIAILAAVGIVALLSALNSGRKSSATTVLRNGISAVRAWQSSSGQSGFTGISHTVMNSAEPDITWVDGATAEATAGANSISIYLSGTNVYMASKSEKNTCYYTRLITFASGSIKSTQYASAASGATCSGTGSGGSTYYNSPKEGWAN